MKPDQPLARRHMYVHYKLIDAYKFYRKNPKYKKYRKYIYRHKYFSIVREFNKFLVDSAIEGKMMQLPCLGRLMMVKQKPTAEFVDWGKLMNQGIYVPYDNSHTDGYVCKMHYKRTKWFKNCYNVKMYMYKSTKAKISSTLRAFPEIHKRYRIPNYQ